MTDSPNQPHPPAPPSPEGFPPDGAPPDGVPMALWPALVWIAAGAYEFALAPVSFAVWKGVFYFLLGAPALLLVAGTAAARLRLGVGQMVADVFPREDWFTGLLSASLRIMLGVVEALMVIFAARGALAVLGI